MKVLHIPVLSDNYAYLLIDESSNKAAAVDPAGPDAVLAAAAKEKVDIMAILTTHHHWDHAGGNLALLKKLPKGTPVYGGDPQIAGLTDRVGQGDNIKIGDVSVDVLFTPCHTKGHVLYHAKSDDTATGALFSGDTLFIGGCGRFFEGTGAQMQEAFDKIGALPDDTKIYCGHEYTVSNLKFASAVEPSNPALQAKLKWANEQRAKGLPTIPSTVGGEKSFNPFMRTRESSVAEAAKVGTGNAADVMDALRQMKNQS